MPHRSVGCPAQGCRRAVLPLHRRLYACVRIAILPNGSETVSLNPSSQVGSLSNTGVMTAGQIVSKDKGLTWSTPTDLNALMPAGRRNMVAGEGPGAMQLSLDHPKFPGRLLFIGHKWSPSGNYTGPPDPFAYVWFSDDGGKSYGFGSSLGANLNEGTLAELSDGSILANIRPDSSAVSPTGARVTAVSTDGGSTFSVPKPDVALINGHCQASMLRASGSRILFANPASSHGRCNGTLRISASNGTSTASGITAWAGEIALGNSSASEAFAYSCLTHLPNGSDSQVGVIFETAAPGCDGVSCQLRFRTVALIESLAA